MPSLRTAVRRRASRCASRSARVRGRQVATGVPEHHPLVARAHLVVVVGETVADLLGLVDAHRDVGRLLVDRRDDCAGVGIEPERATRVADAAHGVAHGALVVDVRLGGDLARDHDQAGGAERLARDPALRVLLEDRVEHGVADLVGHLVGVAFGDRLRREREVTHEELSREGRRSSRPATLSKMTPARSDLASSGSALPPSASRMTARLVSTSKPASGCDVVAHDEVEAFGAQLLRRVHHEIVGLGREADEHLVRGLVASRSTRKSCVGSSTMSGMPSCFFSLRLGGSLGRKPRPRRP